MSGPVTPAYPSTIQVSGLGPAEDVNASLVGLVQSAPSDLDVLLQGPSGQSVLLMSDAPNASPACNDDVAGVTLTFDDSAAGPIPEAGPLTQGTFKPTNYDNVPGPCAPPNNDLTPPATATTLSVFNGANPNGTWNLYAYDDATGAEGVISGGWALDIVPTNDFTLGKVKKRKNKGIALLTVDVPGPGTLALTGAGIKAQRSSGGAMASKAVAAAGPVTLRVKAKGAKKAKLNDKGSVKVKAKVSYTPTGGTPGEISTRRIKLIKR